MSSKSSRRLDRCHDRCGSDRAQIHRLDVYSDTLGPANTLERRVDLRITIGKTEHDDGGIDEQSGFA